MSGLFWMWEFWMRESFIHSKGKSGNDHNFPKAASTSANAAPFLEQRLLPLRSKVEIHRLYFGHKQFWWVLQAHKGKGGCALITQEQQQKERKSCKQQHGQDKDTLYSQQLKSTFLWFLVKVPTLWLLLCSADEWHVEFALLDTATTCPPQVSTFLFKLNFLQSDDGHPQSGQVQSRKPSAVRQRQLVKVLFTRAAHSQTEEQRMEGGGRISGRGGAFRGWQEGWEGVFWWNLSDWITVWETSLPSSSTTHPTVVTHCPSSWCLPSSSTFTPPVIEQQ